MDHLGLFLFGYEDAVRGGEVELGYELSELGADELLGELVVEGDAGAVGVAFSLVELLVLLAPAGHEAVEDVVGHEGVESCAGGLHMILSLEL